MPAAFKHNIRIRHINLEYKVYIMSAAFKSRVCSPGYIETAAYIYVHMDRAVTLPY